MIIGGMASFTAVPGALGMLRSMYGVKPREELAVKLWDMDFASPIGLAAGLDKNAAAVRGFSAIGFGFVEVGTVTPRPQAGNDKPRLFRLPEDRALINRMGFNNVGADQMAEHLARLTEHEVPIAVNIGKNKTTPNELAEEDYRICIQKLYTYGDFFVVNISSPNTPDLRNLQHGDDLRRLLDAVIEERNEQQRVHGGPVKPVLVKIAPDVSQAELEYMVGTITASGTSGIIATNTTISRAGLQSGRAGETGGLSGRPLTERSTETVSQIYRLTAGKIPIIGCGGIFEAQHAYDKIRAGASMVEVYTALIYEGPALLRKLNEGLTSLLQKDGFTHISQAVGVDCR